MPEYPTSPWNGLTAIDVRGPNGSTLFNLSIDDVHLRSHGNQATSTGLPGGSFSLRFEWIHTRQGAPVPTLVVIEFRDFDNQAVQIGTVDWNPTPTASNGVATRTCHFDTEPLDQALGTSRSGKLYMHLYLEYKPGADIQWWADSLGNSGGTQPLPFHYARGILEADPPPTLDIQDFSDTEGSAGSTSIKDFLVTVTLSKAVSQSLDFTYYTGDRHSPAQNGTATAGTDYKSKESKRTIPAGGTSTTVRMEVYQDTTSESDETFFAMIKDPVITGTTTPHPDVVIGRNKATVTIIDDEAPPPPPPNPGTEGFMAGFLWSAMQTNPSNMDNYLGKKLPCVRIFDEWSTGVNSRVSTAASQGRLVLWSNKPPKNSSGTHKWTKITDGSNDAGIDSLGTSLKNVGREIIFIFHHEPHDDASDLDSDGTTGTSSEYRAAFRYIHDRWKNKGILAKESTNNHVWLGYCAGDGGAKGSHNPISGGTDPMYPGGDYVDVLCHDAYNWVFNNGRNDAWESFQQTWEKYIKVAHVQRKKLVAGETGSYKGTGGNSRNQWFRDAANWIKTGTIPANQGFPSEPVSKWFKGFCYFNRLHQDSKGASEWRFVDQDSNGTVFDKDDGRVGWQDAFRDDSFFVSTPFTLRDGATPGQVTFVNSATAATEKGHSGGGITVAKPNGVQAGDLLVASLQGDYALLNHSGPSGWTLCGWSEEDAGQGNEQEWTAWDGTTLFQPPDDRFRDGKDLTSYVFFKIAGSSEPSTYHFPGEANSGTIYAGSIMAWRGASQSSPVREVRYKGSTPPGSVTCPSVATVTGGIVIHHWIHDDPARFATPADMTRIDYKTHDSGIQTESGVFFLPRSGSKDDSGGIAWKSVATGGTSGSKTVTITSGEGGGHNDMGVSISLRPA